MASLLMLLAVAPLAAASPNGTASNLNPEMLLRDATRALDQAQRQVTEARHQLAEAQVAFDAAANAPRFLAVRLREAFGQSSEYWAAAAAVDTAVPAREMAEVQVLVRLAEDPDYRAAATAREETTAQLHEEHDAEHPDQGKLRELAAQLITLGSRLGRLREVAFAADPQVVAARRKTTEAEATLRDLRRQCEAGLANHPQMKAARQTVVDARADLATAEQALARAEADLTAKQGALAEVVRRCETP